MIPKPVFSVNGETEYNVAIVVVEHVKGLCQETARERGVRMYLALYKMRH